jgi:drug/metabolite transporter (DMT)-like permease
MLSSARVAVSTSTVADPPPTAAGPAAAARRPFATLYVVWGSTYLAIRLAVATWPPLLMASIRFGIAGAMLYAFQRARGVPAPDRRGWGAAAVAGGLLLGVGNGTVSWAEQWVPSGITALIVSSVPLWMTVLPWLARRGPAPRPLVLVGVVAGLGGVAVLLVGGASGHPAGARVAGGGAWAPAMLLFATLIWSVGSLWSRKLPLPSAPFMATAAEMLTAAPMMFIASAVRGELGGLSAQMLAPRPLAAVGYLVVFGSIGGFGSYVWLLQNVSAARASTYAFVNPLIAVLVGWAIAGEPIGARTLAATPLIVLSVAAVVWGTAPRPSRVGGDGRAAR